MAIEITIPRLGWSMEEGNFVSWRKKEGEPVKSGEPLFTLENEKATQDVEASDAGVLLIPTNGPKTGQVVKVGQVIGYLLMANESREAVAIACANSPAYQSPDETSNEEIASNSYLSPKAGKLHETTKPAISPRARRLAAELGIDATHLRSNGRTGRISEKDVREAANRVPSPGLSVMRRTIAQRTSASFASTPHFYIRSEVDATELIRLRADLLADIERRSGVRLTLTDLLLRAQAKVLKSFPAANAVWANDSVVRLPNCDVGLVVGLPEGMRIPIVRSVEEGDLAMLSRQRFALVEAARSGKLTLEAMQGGATSLSNLGNTRVDEFAAVISPGQSTMLAVGRASPRPFTIEGKLTVRTTLRLCLSVDHRVLDGAPAAEFFGQIVQLLEEPGKLV